MAQLGCRPAGEPLFQKLHRAREWTTVACTHTGSAVGAEDSRPPRGRRGGPGRRHTRPEAARAPRDPRRSRERGRLRGSAHRRALGRVPAGERSEDAAGLRLAASQARWARRGALETHGHGYSLALEPGELDASASRRCSRRGAARSRGRARSALRSARREHLRSGAGLRWPTSRYASFAQPEIARLDELRLAAREERIEADLASGRHAEAHRRARAARRRASASRAARARS